METCVKSAKVKSSVTVCNHFHLCSSFLDVVVNLLHQVESTVYGFWFPEIDIAKPLRYHFMSPVWTQLNYCTVLLLWPLNNGRSTHSRLPSLNELYSVSNL